MIAAILIFALFAWVIVEYFDFFQFLCEQRVLRHRLRSLTPTIRDRSITSITAHTPSRLLKKGLAGRLVG